MKIDFSIILQDPDNYDEQAKDQKGSFVTLGTIARTALNVELKDESRSGEDKYAAYKLANKIRTAKGLVDLKVDQVTLIKKRIGKAYPAAISGQCWDLLDPPSAEEVADTAS